MLTQPTYETNKSVKFSIETELVESFLMLLLSNRYSKFLYDFTLRKKNIPDTNLVFNNETTL